MIDCRCRWQDMMHATAFGYTQVCNCFEACITIIPYYQINIVAITIAVLPTPYSCRAVVTIMNYEDR